MNQRFDSEAKKWDKLQRRVENAKNIAKVIKENIDLNKDMHIMDFGAGTGLLSSFLDKDVKKITAVDSSSAMIEEFLKKDFACQKDAILADFEKEQIVANFDGIISSMTLHHIKDIEKVFKKFHEILNEGGFIAIADLDKEDGSFHERGNNGVFHFGFDFEKLSQIAKKVGFRSILVKNCGIIKKSYKDFLVKILIGYKVS